MKRTLVVAILGLVFGMAQTPVADQPELAVSLESAQEYLQSPVVEDADGSLRREGVLHFTARADLDLKSLTSVDGAITLVQKGEVDSVGTMHLAVRVPDSTINEALERLLALPGVIVASKVSLAKIDGPANDPFWPTQKYVGAYLLNMDEAWDLTHGRSSVRVAVIDTGVNGVPELASVLEPGLNLLESPPTEDTTDTVGHGTAVASLIAARHNNNVGSTGLAPGVRILPLKACYLNAFEAAVVCDPFLYAEALRWAFDQGDVDVINMSFGGPQNDGNVEYWIDLLTGEIGGWTIVVAAAGNDGEDGVEFPARYGPVIAVGGINPDGSRHPSSTYGSDLDLAAPYVTVASGINGGTEYFDGTSAATPVISALAALYKSEYPLELQVQFPFLGVACSWTNQGGCNWNSQTGRGVPDVYKMLWWVAALDSIS